MSIRDIARAALPQTNPDFPCPPLVEHIHIDGLCESRQRRGLRPTAPDLSKHSRRDDDPGFELEGAPKNRLDDLVAALERDQRARVEDEIS